MVSTEHTKLVKYNTEIKGAKIFQKSGIHHEILVARHEARVT
jgi:hypothetical protein